MSQLPARPDLDQLRRQARELHRAARGGDARSLRRHRQAPGTVTLSDAQLAIARDYGFASWPRLKAEVERRRAALARFLTAEADDLITGQYCDRPRLRPILDVVLAVLPELGPVTVQARGTIDRDRSRAEVLGACLGTAAGSEEMAARSGTRRSGRPRLVKAALN